MSDEQEVKYEQNDEVFIEVAAELARKAAATKDPRIATLASNAMDEAKNIPMLFEKLLLKVTEPAAPQQPPYQSPFLPPTQRM